MSPNPTTTSTARDLPPHLERERLHLGRLKQQGILPRRGVPGVPGIGSAAALGRVRSASVSSSTGIGSGSRSQSGTSRSWGGSRTRRSNSRPVQEEEFAIGSSAT
ncbi:hypothetical protein D9611_014572 [Ephemerocybe angulata]|uniref:Uncharacterized protein n=1 Tax=Ephemerocybe angulata TaxID=980116 RepID=A0A8H5C3D3_9AGAR|nr:hypothetical protein D9611_014572 [Tulosesus angulatus]